MIYSTAVNNLKTPSNRICKECGATYLGLGNSKYCSRTCVSRNEYAANMYKPEWRLNKLLAMAKNRATSKGLPFNLTLDYLTGLWADNLGCCALSGIPFELGRPARGKVHPYAPSIDRISPKSGYVCGNVRIIVYQLNVALSEFGVDQFEELISHYNSFRG